MIRVPYTSPQALIDAIHEMLDVGETQLVLDFFTCVYNPHEVIAVYDLLDHHIANSGLEVIVRLHGLSNVFNLCIAGVTKPENRLVSNLGCHYFHKLMAFGFGTAKDLIIAANANIALEEKIVSFITTDYSVSREELTKLMNDSDFVENTELFSWGLTEWKSLAQTSKIVNPYQSPEREETVPADHSGIEGA
jgi:hypothetical protein